MQNPLEERALSESEREARSHTEAILAVFFAICQCS